jgi:hypothetical protein
VEGAIQNHNSLCRIATRTYNVKGIARKLIDQNNAEITKGNLRLMMTSSVPLMALFLAQTERHGR